VNVRSKRDVATLKAEISVSVPRRERLSAKSEAYLPINTKLNKLGSKRWQVLRMPCYESKILKDWLKKVRSSCQIKEVYLKWYSVDFDKSF